MLSPRCRMTGSASHPSRVSPPKSESPGAEEIEPQLSRCLLLDLGCIPRTCNIARTGLYASLRCVKTIETIFDLETEVVPEVVGIHKTESSAQSQKCVPSDLLADDRPRIQKTVEIRVARLLRPRVVDAPGLDLHDIHQVTRDRTRQQ